MKKMFFLKVLKEMKAPNEYAPNISRCMQVKKEKIIGLKSCDCHLLMQEFLPIAIRGLYSNNVCAVIIGLCQYFEDVCSKVLCESDLEVLETRIPLTLCKLEKIFSPPFFIIIVYLVVHLVTKAKIASPVIYRWMYSI